MSSFRRLMDSIADVGRDILTRRGIGAIDNVEDLIEISRSLISNKADVLGLALSKRLIDGYGSLDDGARRSFFLSLRDDFSPDEDALRDAIETYKDEASPENALAIHEAAEAPRQALVRAMNTVPEAMGAVVHMREDLLSFLREDSHLHVVDRDFEHVLTSWFNKGFLELRRIDWHSPASVLEQLIRYEAVHDITGWDDLRRRLANDRRCYGFFHPALPDQILIFIEVALTHEISANVRDIIDSEPDPDISHNATTAIFYSINNCQRGLRGISFGNFLIKRVVAQLQLELPTLKNFSTLSPIPGYRKWLGATDTNLAEWEKFAEIQKEIMHPDFEPMAVTPDMRLSLEQLCAHYLTSVKAHDNKPRDPVARFHLGNGARLERINWMGDPTERGKKQSFGLLANYLYDLETLEANHQAFHEEGEVHRGKSVRQLLT